MPKTQTKGAKVGSIGDIESAFAYSGASAYANSSVNASGPTLLDSSQQSKF